MNKNEALEIYKWRRGLVDSFESITSAIKSSNDLAEKNVGQLDLYSEVIKVDKVYPKVKIPNYSINIIEEVNKEVELLGIPFTYDPIDDLQIYSDVYCSHNPVNLLELVEDTKDIVILGRISDIEYRKSKKSGNPYAKIRISSLPEEYYFYLTGKRYVNNIAKMFLLNHYLFRLTFSMPTKDYPYESISIERVDNILDLDIEGRIKELYNSCKVEELDEKWMIKKLVK